MNLKKNAMFFFFLGLSGAVGFGTANAATLFYDGFQSTADLAAFNSGSSADIVAAPGGGNALGFTAGASGGDLFSTNTYSSAGGSYILSFDYLGIGLGGGYVGVNAPYEIWLAGDGSWPSMISLNDNIGWNSYSIAFSAPGPVQIKLEEWIGSNSTPNQALFRNLLLTDGDGPTIVPEPAALLLMALGFALMSVKRSCFRSA